MFISGIVLCVEFSEPVNVEDARAAIEVFPGVKLCDDPARNSYPTPLQYASKANSGSLRRDSAFDNGLALFVVGDQLLKGAALNALQIAEVLHERNLMRVPQG